jgi:uncharacterized membrane protein
MMVDDVFTHIYRFRRVNVSGIMRRDAFTASASGYFLPEQYRCEIEMCLHLQWPARLGVVGCAEEVKDS